MEIYLLTIKLDLKNEYKVETKVFSTREEAEGYKDNFIKNRLREIFGFDSYEEAAQEDCGYPDTDGGDEYFSCDIIKRKIRDGERINVAV